MIASLAMYDLPWLRAANDGLWHAVARHLRNAGEEQVPEQLTRGHDLDAVWRSPDLLLGQTCGYPLMTGLRDAVQLVATPCYSADGCVGPTHRSAILVRADHPAQTLADLRGLRLGVNDPCSNSGMNLLRAAIAPLAAGGRFFGEVVATGAHARSFAAVLSGRIDTAAIDAVTLAHLRRRYPRRSGGLRILAWTPPSPALPLVTAAATATSTVAALRRALAAVAADSAIRPILDVLAITGFAELTIADYQPVLALQRDAVAAGYPELA